MYNNLGKTQKAYTKNKPLKTIIPSNCVAIFPIELVGGKTQVCNQGILPPTKSYNKGSFLYYQEVLDGRSALKIMWKNSIKLKKPLNENFYIADTHLGDWYYGKPISMGEERLEIGEDASFEEFLSLKASQTITLYFEYSPTNRIASKEQIEEFFRFKLKDDDIYNFYLIPEICEEKIMYIENHQEVYDDLTGNTKGCQITFSTLGDKIQKSGKAIEQYCAWNAPGEFYVKPKVNKYYDGTTKKWFRYITIDPAGELPRPIKYLQVEQQGPALTSTIYALGRRQEKYTDPVTNKVYWKIGPSKIICPSDFIVTQPNPLNRTSAPSKNYFFFDDEQVSFTTTSDYWELVTNTAQQPLEQMKNSGLVSLGKEDSWLEIAKGTHKSNEIQANGTWKDYFDTTWNPTGWRGANQKSFNTNGCIYSEDVMSYTETDTLVDIFTKNIFIFNQQPTIPLSFSATRPYYLRDTPVIGTIANFFKLGDFHLNNNTTNRKCGNLAFFGDCALTGMCANLQQGCDEKPEMWVAGTVCFPLNFFGNTQTQWSKLGVNALNTTFCMELTDRIMLNTHGLINTYDTVLLGQRLNPDLTQIFDDNASLLANSSIKPIKSDTSGYIIDAVIVQSIFDGKIKISCYSEPEKEFIFPEWTATILSNANWEGGAMRDWTNFFMLSNWEERFCQQEDTWTWPQAPSKDETEDIVIEEDQDIWIYSLTYDENGTNLKQNNDWVSGEKWREVIPTMKNSCLVKGDGIPQQLPIIPYSELGIPSVVDKDTFITHIDSVRINYNNSYLSYYEGETQLCNKLWTKGFDDDNGAGLLFSTACKFQHNVYSYTTKRILIPNVNDGIFPLGNKKDYYSQSGGGYTISGNYDTLYSLIKFQHENISAYNGMGVGVQIDINLDDSGIRISFTDKSIIETEVPYYVDTTQDWLIHNDESISKDITMGYKIHIAGLKFIKKA